MKCGKAAGTSGIIAEMLKAAGEEGVELVRLLAETVFSSRDIPKDWEESFILNLYKGKNRIKKLLKFLSNFYESFHI